MDFCIRARQGDRANHESNATVAVEHSVSLYMCFFVLMQLLGHFRWLGEVRGDTGAGNIVRSLWVRELGTARRIFVFEVKCHRACE